MSARPLSSGWTRFLLIVGVLWLSWIVAAIWVVPALIGSAYEGRSLSFLNNMLAGRNQHDLDRYLTTWRALAARASLTLLAVSAVASVAFALRRLLTRALLSGFRSMAVPVEVRAVHALLIAAWIGVATGVIEAARRMVLDALHQWPTQEFYWDMLWMAPVANAVVMVVVVLLLLPVLMPLRTGAGLRLLPAILICLAAYALIRAAGGVHPSAAILLALGTCAAAMRIFGRSPRKMVSFMRRSGITVTVFLMGFSFVLHGFGRFREWSAVDRLPAVGSGAPNVLLLILDTVRAQSLSVMGYTRATTPGLERLAQRGVVFESAWATSPWTLPSHASIFTGRPVAELSTNWLKALDETYPTLAEVLAQRGYLTGGFVSNFNYASRNSGLGRGFLHYDDAPLGLALLSTSAWLPRRIRERFAVLRGDYGRLVHKTAEDVNRAFLDWLPRESDRPFFAFLNYLDAHDPYDPPDPWKNRFARSSGRYWYGYYQRYTTPELQQLRDHYDGAIAYIDAQITDLLAQLDERGQLQNTLLIITSDHGEQIGERSPNLVKHAWSLYAPALHVPLVVSMPGRVPAAQRVSRPVSLANIPATVLDLLDIGDRSIPGQSLARFWTAGEQGWAGDTIVALLDPNPRQRLPAAVPIGRGPMRSLIVGRLHYILNGDAAEELYDVKADPWERSNLIKSRQLQPALNMMRAALRRLRIDDGLAFGSERRSEF